MQASDGTIPSRGPAALRWRAESLVSRATRVNPVTRRQRGLIQFRECTLDDLPDSESRFVPASPTRKFVLLLAATTLPSFAAHAQTRKLGPCTKAVTACERWILWKGGPA